MRKLDKRNAQTGFPRICPRPSRAWWSSDKSGLYARCIISVHAAPPFSEKASDCTGVLVPDQPLSRRQEQPMPSFRREGRSLKITNIIHLSSCLGVSRPAHPDTLLSHKLTFPLRRFENLKKFRSGFDLPFAWASSGGRNWVPALCWSDGARW